MNKKTAQIIIICIIGVIGYIGFKQYAEPWAVEILTTELGCASK